ncbi:MAG: pyruvate dehydrogenase complex dihydrolipoamide acetyltransferase [Candidatus Lambdaproteobacteria bacterium]|nr:pyruvate dehydrogenase complex dihydrolipoamide acetyltransferase [Candidatus Lambdaproteobacteria bacterium]
MALLLTMPSLSPTMETGVITAWRKQVGDRIEVGEVLAEIETDKAVMDYEVVDEGYVREFLVETGQEIAVGTPICILSATAEEDIAALRAQARSAAVRPAATAAAPAPQPQAAAPAPQPAAPDPRPAASPALQPVATPLAAAQAVAAQAVAAPMQAPPPLAPPPAPGSAGRPSGNGAGRVRISPFARKLAEQQGLDWQALQGTGPAGRIVARDVEAAITGGAAMTLTGPPPAPAARPTAQALPGFAPAAQPAAPAQSAAPARPAPTAGGAGYEDLPLSMMRKAIARKMAESKQTVPHFQTTRKVRMEKLLELRASLKAQFPDVRISLNDLLVKACAVALRRHPVINSQFLGDRIRRFAGADIAVAVNTDDGLITPVLRNVEAKGLQQIAAESRALADKARERKLVPEDYQGGTFTISNMGMFGIYEFNAIINTPQACILAVAGVVREPVVEGERIVIGQTMHLTLSSDHRAVDGVAAAEFLATLCGIIENPLSLLL